MGIMDTVTDSEPFQDEDALRPLGLREEIAQMAARLIAEEGLDYASAKKKALEQRTGQRQGARAKRLLPSNEAVEEALRVYQRTFMADEQPQRLRLLRQKSLALLTLLSDFNATVTGAVVNGTAHEFSDIHIQCFADSAKDLGIFLLNQGISFEAAELAHHRHASESIEALAIQWQGELAVISVYPYTDQRGAMKPNQKGRLQRLDAAGLTRLLDESLDDHQK